MVGTFCPCLVYVIIMDAACIWDKMVIPVGITMCEFQEESEIHEIHCGEPLSPCPSFRAAFRLTNKSPSKTQLEQNKTSKL